MTIVTLTTDFGTVDGYVGEMKGVILERAPGARLVDVTHDVPPGDVRSGTWVLDRIWSRFPVGTIHVAVVDPGVGGDRRAVAARLGERWFVGPDNGLLTRPSVDVAVPGAFLLDPEKIGLKPLSDTFHGRDLFAPAAAHLADRGNPSELGPPVEPGELVRLELPAPAREGDLLRGEVIHVDRFGNLVTNIPSGRIPRRPVARIGEHEVRGLRGSFDAVEAGSVLLVRGSGGSLEISVRDGSAARRLGVGRGEPVEVRPDG